MDSKLPVEILGKIWDLADLDKDGSLSRHEFMIAMHLVYKALEKHTIPNTLPPELMPPGKRKESIVLQSNLVLTPTKVNFKLVFIILFITCQIISRNLDIFKDIAINCPLKISRKILNGSL